MQLIRRMEQWINSPRDALICSVWDANCRSCQEEAEEADRDKPGVSLSYWFYKVSTILFLLCIGFETFQRTREVFLSAVKRRFVFLYSDYIIIFSKTANDHIKHACSILLLLQRAGVRLSLKQLRSFTEKIEYLGHAIRPGRLNIASYITGAMGNLNHEKLWNWSHS